MYSIIQIYTGPDRECRAEARSADVKLAPHPLGLSRMPKGSTCRHVTHVHEVDDLCIAVALYRGSVLCAQLATCRAGWAPREMAYEPAGRQPHLPTAKFRNRCVRCEAGLALCLLLRRISNAMLLCVRPTGSYSVACRRGNQKACGRLEPPAALVASVP
jgi:hypothetical protein